MPSAKADNPKMTIHYLHIAQNSHINNYHVCAFSFSVSLGIFMKSKVLHFDTNSTNSSSDAKRRQRLKANLKMK